MNSTHSKRLRQFIGQKLWDLGSWVYQYEASMPVEGTDRARSHEVGITFWGCSDAEAEEVFLRLSDAVCGVDHHALECPGPSHVMSMRNGPLDDDNAWPSDTPITTANGRAKVTYRKSASS